MQYQAENVCNGTEKDEESKSNSDAGVWNVVNVIEESGQEWCVREC